LEDRQCAVLQFVGRSADEQGIPAVPRASLNRLDVAVAPVLGDLIALRVQLEEQCRKLRGMNENNKERGASNEEVIRHPRPRKRLIRMFTVGHLSSWMNDPPGGAVTVEDVHRRGWIVLE